MYATGIDRRLFPSGSIPWPRWFFIGAVVAALCAGPPLGWALTPEEIAELRNLAKEIVQVDIKPLDPQTPIYGKPYAQIDLKLVALDKSGDEVVLTSDQANALFDIEGALRNPVGSTVVVDGGQAGFQRYTYKGEVVNNHIRFIYGDDWGSARFMPTVRPEFQKYLTAPAPNYMMTIKKPTPWSKASSAIKAHPYVSASVAGAAVAGVVTVASVADGGGGGGDGGGGGGSTGGSLAGILNGNWSGSVSGMQLMETPERGSIGGRFKMFISVSGHVSGNYSGDYSGSISGSVSSSGQLSVSAGGGAGLARWSGTIRRSGSKLYGSGTWSASMGSGRWSGSGVSSAP